MARAFSGLGSSSGMTTSLDIVDGRYLFAIKSIKMVGAEENFFCPEVVILEAGNVKTDANDRPLLREGDIASVRWDIVNPPKAWMRESNLGRIKALLMALWPAEDPSEIDENFAEYVVGPDQPGRGRLVRCNAISKNNKTKEGAYCHLNWSPADEEDYKEHKDRVARILR